MSSLDRMLDILDAFTLEAPTRSTDELIKFTGSSRSELSYRYRPKIELLSLNV